MKKDRPQSRKQNLVEQEVDGELLIYDLERNRAFCLNQTSALVWQACDGKRTVAEIGDILGKQLKAQTDEDIVWLALDQLSREKLIEPPVDVVSKFEGMSRREVVKKIGIGSMIALPIVASLVAPTAIHAQSGGLAPGAPSGTATITGLSCGAPDALARAAQCNTQTGMNCMSGMATSASPGVCVGNATQTCQCA
ncbi:MAG: hypothetical protein DMF62_06280 [Acidobacteria bacterium]|nr:MAG: hypothetical protein DMF62_06280 [Acidobacteriota bacterium]